MDIGQNAGDSKAGPRVDFVPDAGGNCEKKADGLYPAPVGQI
ncbi:MULTISPECIES: hypothetical protein [unclassified Microcoleus]|nr:MULTISPECIES: hypothetical protein [unclassified Microcoleus]